MYGQISTPAFIGIEARPVEVQVRVTPGAAAFAIVGLPDKAVAESRERVRNALHAVGLGLPYKHITVNLAPADLPKEGSHFDLPIVLAMMCAMEAIAPDAIANYAAIGELALDGSIRAVPGTLPAAIGANMIGKGLICPAASGPEAAWASEDIDILAAPHLSCRSSTTSRACRPWHGRSRMFFRRRATLPTFAISKVRKRPNEPSKLPPPATTTA